MNFDELCGSAKKIAQDTAKKLESTADLASLHIKLNAAQTRLEEAYLLLGRSSYLHFTRKEDFSERVALAVENVNRARREVLELKGRIEEIKRRRAEVRACREEADAAAEEPQDGNGSDAGEEAGEENA